MLWSLPMKIDLHRLLQDCGALLEGHFLLTSGRHSDRYIEKFRLLEQPAALDKVATAMTEDVRPDDVDVVLGAAVGGILIAGAVSRKLGRRTLFTERVAGAMTLRRGFRLAPGERVLVVEDIVTTGGSVFELLKVVDNANSQVAGVVCLVDRSTDGLDFGVPSKTLLRLPIATWEPDACPLCHKGVPLTKPGRTGKS